MSSVTPPSITPIPSTESVSSYTTIRFEPDLALFKLASLKSDILDIMTRRVYDIAACHQVRTSPPRQYHPTYFPLKGCQSSLKRDSVSRQSGKVLQYWKLGHLI